MTVDEQPGTSYALGAVAERLGIGRLLVMKLIQSGELVAHSDAGGRMTVQSKQLDDFIARFDLQALTAQAAQALGNAEPRDDVVIAEDQEAMSKLLTFMVSKFLQKVPIRHSTSGVQTLFTLLSHPPRVMLLDIMMPGLDGFDVLQEFLRLPKMKKTRVLIVTAYEDISALEALRARNEQIVAIIGKPITNVNSFKDYLLQAWADSAVKPA